MGHGTPDWWGSEPGETIFQVQDVGELAVRLGSIDTFDRRGNVIFLTGFEDGIAGWLQEVIGTGSALVVSTTQKRSGAYSMKIIPPTSAPYGEVVSLLLVYPRPGRLGAEFAFTVPWKLSYLRLWLLIYDGTNLYTAGIEYDHLNTQVEYYSSAGAWTTLDSNVSLAFTDWLFHILKVVVDTEEETYHRLLLDSKEWALTSYSLEKVANDAPPYMEIRIEVKGQDNSQPPVWVDDLIITQNEP